MEMQKLRDMDYQSDGPEMQRVWDMMFCRDPLTLERAVEVMGRKPDWKRDSKARSVIQWDSPDITVSNWNVGETVIQWDRNCRVIKTVGQFACLVLAAVRHERGL